MKPYARICCSAAILASTALVPPIAAALELPNADTALYATAPPGGSGVINVDEICIAETIADFDIGEMLQTLYDHHADLPAWAQMHPTIDDDLFRRAMALAEFEGNGGIDDGALDVVIRSREHDTDNGFMHNLDADDGYITPTDDPYDGVIPAPHVIDLVANPGPKPMLC